MSFHDAMIDIAERMEKEAEFWPEDGKANRLLSGFAQEIRIVLKASSACVPFGGQIPSFRTPEEQHAVMIQKAREEFRMKKPLQESELPKMVTASGGEWDGSLIAIPPDSRPGSRLFDYILGEDNVLHFQGDVDVKSQEKVG